MVIAISQQDPRYGPVFTVPSLTLSNFAFTEFYGLPGSFLTRTAAWVYILISNAKAFLLGTYHGLDKKHLQSYFDEFCFRFNRRFWHEQLFPRLVCAVAASNILGYVDLTR